MLFGDANSLFTGGMTFNQKDDDRFKLVSTEAELGS